MHATVDFSEYLPVAHAVQLTLPFAVSVLVVDPGAQAVHGRVDADEYWPASHDLHEVAPGWSSVSVYEPAAHSSQVVDCLPL